MNLGDPELELIDPTPNVHLLFVHFDKLFFTAKLSNRVVVRWSKRMYSCAGVCSYEGRSGFCDIALSEPLLKLRPRKDLVETLLHEMIHAYLFVVKNDRDRDGHGPNFKAHMHRINELASLNISIYHNFIDEVKLYQTHVWRCNGPCQSKKPHFGIVRRSVNKAPGPSDYWWSAHKARCGGTFIKIKEPNVIPAKTKNVPKSNVITNYIPTNKIINNVPKKTTNPVLKDSNYNINKSNNNKVGVINNNGLLSSKLGDHKPLLNVKGHTVGSNRHRSNSADVVETLRNVWGNKQFPNSQTKEIVMSSSPDLNPNKHKIELHHLENTPAKIRKINEYFKATGTEVLRNVYGKDIKLCKSSNGTKFIAVINVNLVPCPVCNSKVRKDEINRHLDECLNKDVINKLSKDNVKPTSSQSNETNRLKQIVGTIPKVPQFKDVASFKITNEDIKLELPDSLDSSLVKELFNNRPVEGLPLGSREKVGPLDHVKIDTFQSINKVKKHETTVGKVCDKITKNNKMEVNKTENIKIKVEPGTSKDVVNSIKQTCPCCNSSLNKPMAEHLDECEVLHTSNWASIDENEKLNTTIIIDDDDDIFDESLTLNATGTKTPCPCCFKMVEQANMNNHLDICLK